MSTCLKCGDTGILISGEPCDCGIKLNYYTPEFLAVPVQYQGVRFNSNLLPKNIRDCYQDYMEVLYHMLVGNIASVNKNILLCAPPNSGKSVFAYSVLTELYMKGMPVIPLMDIMEVRQVLMNYYGIDIELLMGISKSKIMFIKIPMDLPNKLAETMSTIIERRVRNNAITIFLYSGTDKDLLAQDSFGKLKMLIGDGSYNSVELKSFYYAENGK